MNARIKKKKFKYKIMNMKPGDMLFIDLFSAGYAMDEISAIVKLLSKVIPLHSSIAVVPVKDCWSKVLGQKKAMEYLNQIKEKIEEIDCANCQYYNKEDDYCSWIACDGLDCDEQLPCEVDNEKNI